MTRKSRYLLIFAGMIIFAALAPITVLFVRGLKYNSKTGTFVQTGLLSFQAEPKNSSLYLDGRLKKTGSGDVDFVPAGEYQVTVSAQGRQEWNKRLFVDAGKVTWANPKDSKIFLFFKEPLAKNLADGVDDFFVNKNKVFYLQKGNFVVSTLNEPEKTHIYPLPQYATKISTQNSSGTKFILSGTDNNSPILYFNTATEKLTDLTKLLKNSEQLIYEDDELYSLNNNILYKVNTEKKNLTQIVPQVKAFYFQGIDLYILAKSQTGIQLRLLRPPYLTSQVLID